MQQEEPNHPFTPTVVWCFRIGLAILIVLAGLGGAELLIKTAPKHDRRKQRERSVVVEVHTLKRQNQPVKLETTGTVVAARELTVSPRVSGYVKRLNPAFQPGDTLKAGDILLSLDKTDFELAVKKAEAAVATAKSNVVKARSAQVTAEYALKLEMGQQDVARFEWQGVADRDKATELDKELTLRKPQLAKAQADLKAAEAQVTVAEEAVKNVEASLEEAKLNLSRTDVRVPFDTVVVNRSVAEGALVSAQMAVGKIAATNECWVEASLPLSELQLVRLPQNGQPGAPVTATLTMGNGKSASWKGDVFQLRPSLEANGRMARVLIRVRNPFNQSFPLLLDSFVHLSIQGKDLENVFVIPRESFHEGNRVWLMNEQQRLAFRTVNPVWSNADIVAVSDSLREGEKLILTNISAASPGLKLVLPGQKPNPRKGPARGRKSQKNSH